jgi:SAM-dependent methyltransferase
MDLGFRGDVADLYRRYRRGYPPAVLGVLADTFELTADDVAVDLGCGTGQLAVPLAARVRAVVGVDPEPDMLVHARRVAAERGVTNVGWLIGADTDVPAVRALLGDGSVAVVAVAQALHWMDHDTLFREVVPLVRPGGGVAVLANGTPLWSQDSDWSRALRRWLEQWLGRSVTATCGTDEATRQRYRAGLADAGFHTRVDGVEYADTLDPERIVGGVLSALRVDQLPAPEQRPLVAEQIEQVLRPHAPFHEHVRVTILTGRR